MIRSNPREELRPHCPSAPDVRRTVVLESCLYLKPPGTQQAVPPTPPALPPRSEPRKNRSSEELLQVHHQKRDVNHRLRGQRQLGHQTSEPKSAFALAKLAFNGHPSGRIVMSLLVDMFHLLGRGLLTIRGRPNGGPERRIPLRAQ